MSRCKPAVIPLKAIKAMVVMKEYFTTNANVSSKFIEILVDEFPDIAEKISSRYFDGGQEETNTLIQNNINLLEHVKMLENYIHTITNLHKCVIPHIRDIPYIDPALANMELTNAYNANPGVRRPGDKFYKLLQNEHVADRDLDKSPRRTRKRAILN